MVYLGIDCGGTSTRAALCRPDGTLLGYGRAPGANLRSSVGDPATNVATAIRAALGATPPGAIVAVGIGAAGAGSARRDEVAALLTHALESAGVTAPARLVTDLEVAFRSAAPEPAGHLLLAGTGAVAARFEDWECVARCDGMGWLLGDEGSGTWLGWQVLRAAAAALDGRGLETALTAAVLEELGIATASGDPRQNLIRAVDDLRAAELARFAPLAFGADPVAQQLVADAAQRLDRTAQAIGAAPGIPLVLAGGLLAQGPLRDALEAHFPHARYAAHPVAGACALAAEQAGDALDRAALLAQLDAEPTATPPPATP